MEDKQISIELELLCGVIDALPCPAALLSTNGFPAYVNPQGEYLKLEDVNLSEMPEVMRCLKGESLPGRASRYQSLKGVLELYPVRNDTRILGALLMLRPESLENERRSLYISGIPTVSEAMNAVNERFRRLSMLGTIALIIGEDGVGKESFARFLHEMGTHSREPFVTVSGAGLSEGELKTAAAAAGTGTFFIHRAEEMTSDLQNALYKIIAEKADGKGELKGRLTVAASPNIVNLVRDGLFDHQLYQRISLMAVTIPPLRERSEDILPAAQAYLKYETERTGRDIEGFSSDARAMLLTNRWYANHAALNEAVKQAVAACPGGLVLASHLPGDTHPNLREQKKAFTKERIIALLDVYGNTVEGKRKCAGELGIGLSTLYRILSK